MAILQEQGEEEQQQERDNKKRKITLSSSGRKLLVGENVEVLFMDEGCDGSWHCGMVIECGIRSRLVKFSNLLDDDNRSKIIQWYRVSAAVEGDLTSTRKDYRGRIRPFPPFHDIQLPEIIYGLCVDALINNAWWEGVVLDKEVGSAVRLIFFPDRGDQHRITFDRLRITQEWNEVTGTWKARGKWILLGVVEKCEQDNGLSVSIGKVWHDLKFTDAFLEKIGVWTRGSQHVWHNMVSKLIQKSVRSGPSIIDYVDQEVLCLKGADFQSDGLQSSSQVMHAVKNCPPMLSDNKVQDACVCSPAILDFNAECHDKDTPQPSDSREESLDVFHVTEPHLPSGAGDIIDNSCVSFDGVCYSSTEACKVSDSIEQENNLHRPMNLGGETSNLVCSNQELESDSEPEEHSDNSVGTSAITKSWQSVTLKAKYCSDLASLIAACGENGNSQRKTQAARKLRKHLLFDGWTIEFKRDPLPRYRYYSPTGKVSYSLCQVCHDLIEGQPKVNKKHRGNIRPKRSHFSSNLHGMISPKVHPEKVSFAFDHPAKLLQIMRDKNHTGHLRSSDARFPAVDGAISKHDHTRKLIVTEIVDADRVLDSNEVVEVFPEDIGEQDCTGGNSSTSGKRSKKMHPTKEGFKTAHLPESMTNYIVEYIDSGKKKKCGVLTENVRKHLVLEGWKLWKKDKKTKMELRYTSPNQKTYYSLYTACTAYMEAASQTSTEKYAGNMGNDQKYECASTVAPSAKKHFPKTMLSWLIDKGMILPRERVEYICRDGHKKVGRITHSGIKCNCCHKMFSLAKFETHAGDSTYHPSANIFLPNGKCLFQLQMQLVLADKPKNIPHARTKGDYSQYESDPECSICRFGGELILCDHCPAAFHLDCVNLVNVPEGKWCCSSCQCRICGSSEYNCDTEKFTGKSILYCEQCEQEYHVSCLRTNEALQLSCCPSGDWLCSRSCSEIFHGLSALVGKCTTIPGKHESCTILRANFNFHDTETSVEHHSKLNVAFDVLRECFPALTESSTENDLLANLLFNKISERPKLNFWGFYTILLEREDELVSAAIFRVYGEKVAEMPFIATHSQFRQQGMCRLLLNELEKLFFRLRVEKMVLPAVPHLLDTWTTSFGFTKMTKSDMSDLLRYNFVNFPDTTMCQKIITRPSTILKEPTVKSDR